MPPAAPLSAGVAQSLPTHAHPSKRIALFTGAYNHIADGVSLTLNRLVAFLEERGVEVLVFAPTVDDPPIDHAGTLVPVPSVPAPGRSDYRISLGMTSAVRERLDAFDPTIVHVATPDLLGRSALQYADRAGVPAVASYHTHFSSYLKYYHLDLLEGVLWRYLRSFYEPCRQIYVPSTAMAEILRSHGIDHGLRLWRRGVNTDRFAPGRRSVAWRRSLGIEDGEAVVTFVSRLVWEKGLGVFADVVERLEAAGVPHRSLVVGDGPARQALEERLDDTLFAGYLEGDDLARAYASSDVFLFPSDTETFGNVTLEAMAAGLPTVCADAAGSRDLVREGTTGHLCPPGDADAFFEATRRLVENPSVRRQMGSAALARARNFTWDKVLGRIDRYYDEVLADHVRSSASPAASPPAASPAAAQLSEAEAV
jgi:glycosyltransferase involved in cell wall biosynthesis